MERSYLEERLASGMTLEQIARELGLHPSTVGYWLEKYNLTAVGADRFGRRGAPNRILLEQLAADGATLREMAETVDRSISTVRHWLAKWNIERPRRTARADPTVDPRLIDRKCHRHGVTRFRLEGRGYYRCLLCRQERVSEWRRRVKRTLIEEAGGRCQICGYAACAAALQFHHVDPSEKSFALSHEGVARNLQLARAEAAKCILLCANCHAEVEVGYRKLPAALTLSL
jgi:transposase